MSITEGSVGKSGPGSDGAVEHCFTLWPNRSLPRSGVLLLVGMVTLGAALPLLQMPAPALWIVGVPCMAMPIALLLAFWANNRAARVAETITVRADEVRVVRSGPAARARVEVFNPSWVRVVVRTDASVAYRIQFAEGRRRLSVGDFLSPEERLNLARALQSVLGISRVDMSEARPSLHEFDAAGYA